MVLSGLRRSLALVFAIALAACAPENINKGYTLSDMSGKGVVVGSVTYLASSVRCQVAYRKLGETEGSYFHGGQSDIVLSLIAGSDIDSGTDTGDLFAVELPAGDYEVYSWNAQSGSAYLGPQSTFSVRFHVEPGKATYLGNFYFEEQNNLGRMTTAVSVEFRDRAARDLKIFASKYPGLASSVKPGTAIEKGSIYKNLGGQSGVDFDIPPPIIFIK